MTNNHPSIVRRAMPPDEGEIWRMFRLVLAENAMFEISERKVQHHIDRFLRPNEILPEDNGPRGVMGVIGPVGALEGIIVLSFGSQWYSDVITVDEMVNFVDPDHRASNHSKALIGYAKYVTDQLRVGSPDLRLIIGILSTKRTAAKVRHYRQQKLEECGAFFVWPPTGIAYSERG